MSEANPYRVPQAPVLTRPGRRRRRAKLVKASRAIRLGAYLLESVLGVVVFSPLLVAMLVTGVFMADQGFGSGDPGQIASEFEQIMQANMGLLMGGCGLSGLLWLAYIIASIYFLATNGQTLGKKCLGIKICRTNGEKAGFFRIVLLRYLVPGVITVVLSLLGPAGGVLSSLFAYVVDPVFIFGEERRCIHDYIADTIVVVA